MSEDFDLERLLRRWGRVFGPPPEREWDEDSSGSAGGLTANLMAQLHVGLGHVGDAAKPKRHVWTNPETGAKVPMDIPGMRRITARGRETRNPHRPPWSPDPEAESVEVAALDLYRYDALRGVVLRIEYCLRGFKQRERAVLVGRVEGMERITLRRYRHELDRAREWMAGRLFGNRAAA